MLGIRHHGPGSARSVADALVELEPDLVVIEGPPELDALLDLAGDPDLVPPVAGLVYAVDAPRRAAFYPLASFSPEWVAMRWAVQAGSRSGSPTCPPCTPWPTGAAHTVPEAPIPRRLQEVDQPTRWRAPRRPHRTPSGSSPARLATTTPSVGGRTQSSTATPRACNASP